MPSTKSFSQLAPELERLGVRFHPRGHVTCSGVSLWLLRRLDALFMQWAAALQAHEYAFPPFISAGVLAKTGYFGSFQHLATFPVTLAADEASLLEFARTNEQAQGSIELGVTAPVEEVLTPAACYHLYAHVQGSQFVEPYYATTKATCFRREAEYRALERQWSFTMREIVCLGDAAAVRGFLASMREKLGRFFAACGLPVTFDVATDPFFRGAQHPKHFAQRLDPVKLEMVLAGKLAIGSLNFHRNYFGEAFEIRHSGELAFSGCVAFGLERWLFAIVESFGAEPRHWPAPFRLDEAAP